MTSAESKIIATPAATAKASSTAATTAALEKQQEATKSSIVSQRRQSNPQDVAGEEQRINEIIVEPVNFDIHKQNHMHGATPDGHHPNEEDLTEETLKRNLSSESFALAFIRRNISKPMLNVVKRSRRGGRRPGKRDSDAEQSDDKLEVDEVEAPSPSTSRRGSVIRRLSSAIRASPRSSLVIAAEEDDMFF